MQEMYEEIENLENLEKMVNMNYHIIDSERVRPEI